MRTFNTMIDCDVLSLLDASGKVMSVSAPGDQVLGHLREDLVGRNARELVHSDDVYYSDRALRQVAAKPFSTCQVEVRVRRKNAGWSPVECKATNLLDEPAMRAILVNSREAGARGTPAEQPVTNIEDLVSANARLEDFTYAVSHDLKEPMRTISMLTELLAKKSTLDASGSVLVQSISKSAARMSALIDGLSHFAITGADVPPHSVDLGLVISEVVLNLGHAITRNHAIITIGPMPCVQGNEGDLVRVLQNIIGNAISYRSKSLPEIHVTAERRGEDWVVRVKDNGVGIAPEYHNVVFNFLTRLHGQETPGSGIGLALCKKLIEKMGGAIWVESASGSGSTFCFTVEASERAATGSALGTAREAQTELYANGFQPTSTPTSIEQQIPGAARA